MPLTPVVSFFVHCFHLLFTLFGRNFLPSILIAILLFLGLLLVPFFITLLVGTSLWCIFGFEYI